MKEVENWDFNQLVLHKTSYQIAFLMFKQLTAVVNGVFEISLTMNLVLYCQNSKRELARTEMIENPFGYVKPEVFKAYLESC